MRLLKTMFSVAAIAVMISSCDSVDFKKTKSGLTYKLLPSSSGTKAAPGGFLKVNLIYKVRDSVLQSTYGTAPTYLPVPDSAQPARPYDITEIAHLLKKGDSVYLVQEIDTLFKAAPPGSMPPFFKKGDKLYTGIKVLEVFPNEAEVRKDYEKEQATASAGQLQKDDKILTDYLAKNNIKANKIGSGTYVQISQPGTGEQVAVGKFVSLKYKGTTLEGKVFDTNMDNSKPPMDFVVGSQPFIKGFEEGIKELKEGAKAKIFIPSALAYGQNAPPEIGANANLIFDVEVLKVNNEAPPSNNLPPPTNDPAGR